MDALEEIADAVSAVSEHISIFLCHSCYWKAYKHVQS
jgi:hypothetical protein